MNRFELRRQIQETQPFDLLTFVTVLVERLTERGLLKDDDVMQMLNDQGLMRDNVHYE